MRLNDSIGFYLQLISVVYFYMANDVNFRFILFNDAQIYQVKHDLSRGNTIEETMEGLCTRLDLV